MGKLIKNGITYSGSVGIVDNLNSTDTSYALSANQGKQLGDDLGPQELTNTATSSHLAGSYFMWKSQFVEATSDIEINDTISTSTNVTIQSVANALEKADEKIGKIQLPNTVVSTDKSAFLSRQCINPEGFTGYEREKLIGASYAWNQLVQNDFVNNYTKVTCIVSESSGVYTLTKSGSQGLMYKKESNVIIPVGHIILIKLTGLSTDVYTSLVRSNSNTIDVIIDANKGYVIYKVVVTDVYGFGLYLNANLESSVSWKTYQCIDLTLTFGNDIANYIYSLEQATAGSGITKLRNMGFPIDKYTPYGYGLYSVKTSGKKIVGKNLVEDVISNSRIDGDGIIYSESTTKLGLAKIIQGKTYIVKSDASTLVAGFFINKPTIGSTSYNASRVVGETGDYSFVAPITGWVAFRSTSSYQYLQCELGSESTIYEEPSITTFSLGNDELRGLFKLVNNEIVVDGDIKESNGEIMRNWKLIDLGTLTYASESNHYYTAPVSDILGATSDDVVANIICAKYVGASANDVYYERSDKIIGISTSKRIYLRDSSITGDINTVLSGVYMICELATPTTEQSTPFADPMSLIGATTEEYIDTRDIPCPVGAERQYMGESDDRMEFPSSPMSDGKRVLTSYKSGNEEKLVWEDSNNVIEFYTRTNFTSAAQLTYTGVSVTIPKGKHFAFSALAIYANARPEEIYISYSNDPTLTYLICAGGARGGASYCGYIRTSDGDTTFYIHARYNGIATNRLDTSGYYF